MSVAAPVLPVNRPEWRPPGEISAEPRGPIRRLPRFADGGTIPPEPRDAAALDDWRAALSAKAVAGCRSAADALLRSFEPDVRRIAARDSDPDAATQAGLLGVLNAGRAFDSGRPGAFTAYALAAARRAIRQRSRTSAVRRGVRSLDRVVGYEDRRGCPLASLIADVAALDPAERAAAKELWLALARLPVRDRRILEGRMAGATRAELADAAGVAEGSVSAVGRRALSRFAAAVGEERPASRRHDPPPVPEELLAALPAPQRFAVRGRQAGRTFRDLADEGGVSQTAVHKSYLRAMRSLGGVFARGLPQKPR